MPNTSKSEEKKKREQGFTLIEVMVAIVILMFGLLAVGSMQISAIRGNFMGGNTSMALSLAGQKMEDLLNSNFNDPPGVLKLTDTDPGNNSTLNSTTNVDYSENVSDDGVVGTGGFFRRIWNIANEPNPTLPTRKSIVVIVTWENNRHRVSIESIKNELVW